MIYKIYDSLCYYIEYYWVKLTYRGQLSHDKGLHSRSTSKSITLSLVNSKYNRTFQFDTEYQRFVKVTNYGLRDRDGNKN